MKTTTATLERTAVPRICTTGTVVCVAPGPSLTEEDVNYVRGKATVVVLNDAWKLAPWADVLYSSDLFWFPYYQWVPAFQGLKISFADISRPRAARDNGIILLKKTGEDGVEFGANGLRTTRNSGGAAINLAIHLGATRVILLGYDMAGTNLFGPHPLGLRKTTSKDYETYRHLISSMVVPLKERGIEVVNCSRKTALKCFPVKPLREVL